MADKYLHRSDAPFSEKVWERIDEIVVGAAKSQLCARRLVHIEGPYGLGLKAIPGTDRTISGSQGEVSLAVSTTVPMVELQSSFILPMRDISAFEETGLPFMSGEIAAAAVACAEQEDQLIFNGSKAVGCDGLLTAKGTQSLKLKPWEKVGTAVDNLIEAVGKLDGAAFHGPYALALAAPLYNLLFRRYPQGNVTEREHLAQLVTEGIVKAPALKSGGVLLASGRQYATIVLGQDLAASFVGPEGRAYQFAVSESVALRLVAPEAVCVLQ